MEGFLGTSAGLSAPTITRLTTQWQDEARAFGQRDLSEVDYVYLWADGVHLNIRLDEEKLCLLVLLGVRVDGTKGADRAGRRVPRADRLVGRPATRLQTPRDARPGTGHR